MDRTFAAMAGATALLAGITLLVLAWRRRKQPRGGLIVGGWILIAASMWPWAVSGGFDRGPAIAVCVITLAAFAIVMFNGATHGRDRKATPDDSDQDVRPPGGMRTPWVRNCWIFLLAGPVAFIASAGLALLTFLVGPGMEADRLALAAYLAPVFWGGLAVWAVTDPKLVRKSVGVVGAGAAAGLGVLALTTVTGA